ncbi:MAG: MAPEG family protein, partial [Pseudomonadota bacterium]
MRQTLIFWPMIAHAFLVFGLYFELGRRRYIAGSRKEIHVKNFRVPKPDSDSEYSGAAARVVINNFEMPTLFHAACLALFLVSAVNLAT